MSKLLKLKEWVSLDDAAKHLTILFGETVVKADVLQLALDMKLTLSVHLVNGAEARCGPIVPIDEAKFTEMPFDLRAASLAPSLKEYTGRFLKVFNGVQVNDTDVIELGEDIFTLHGVFDLPMFGSERLDVQHEYQKLTGGPGVTLQGSDGTFVWDGDKTFYQLQARFDEDRFGLKTIEQVPRQRNSGCDQFEERLEKWRSREGYYPAGTLPADSVLVVRSESLLKLQETASAPARREATLGTRERDTLLKLVIGMAIGAYRYAPDAPRSQVPTEISSDLAKLGLNVSDDTVRKWLKLAATTVMSDHPTKN